VRLGRTAGHPAVVGYSLGMIAMTALERGDMAECARLATEALAAARASSTLMVQGPALSCLAYHAMHEGDLDRAGRLHEELLEMGRRQGEKWGMGIVLFDLACFESFKAARRRPGRCAPRPSLSARNLEIGVASLGLWGFFQPPRRRTDERSRQPACAAPWRVWSRASAPPFKTASTD